MTTTQDFGDGCTWTDEDRINWINRASLEDLLRRWRFSALGDPFFVGDVGARFSIVLFSKRDEDPEAWIAASKKVGWARG